MACSIATISCAVLTSCKKLGGKNDPELYAFIIVDNIQFENYHLGMVPLNLINRRKISSTLGIAWDQLKAWSLPIQRTRVRIQSLETFIGQLSAVFVQKPKNKEKEAANGPLKL